MSKRMEGKQKTPSVIARLMGLDELPPQQPLHRQQKVLSDDYLRRTASIDLLEKRSLNNGRLSKISAEKQDKYFCSSEMSKIDKQIIGSISDEKANPSTVRADFSFSRQRNSHAKYPSKNKKLFHLKGHDDMLEDLCATRDNLPRYYHHPDLSSKQFGDPKDLQPKLHSGRLSASSSTSISDDSDSEVCKKLDKMISRRSLQKLENSCGQTYIDPLDKLKSQLDLKDRSTYFSRRIVVLKPNSGQAQNCARNLLMPSSSMLSQSNSEYMDHGGILKPENGELNIEVPETADATSAIEPPRRSFRVTKGAPKQTAQVVKQNTGTSFGGLSRSRVTADESYVNVSERISCQCSFDCKRRDQISYPFPSGSLFAMEAKKQIFERWKTTRIFQEVEVDGRRCTLGEMFVMHDGGARPKTSCVKFKKYVSSSQFSHEGEKLELGSPLRVGSKYGSKDKHIRNLTSSNLATIGEASQNGSCLGHQDTATGKHNNLKNKASPKEDNLEPRDPRSSCEKQKYSADKADLGVNHNIDKNTMFHSNVLCSGSDDSPVQVTQVIQDDLEFDWDKKDIHREAEHSSITVSNLSTTGLASINASAYEKAEAVVSSEDQLLEIAPSISLIEDDHTSYGFWENLTPQRSSYDSPSAESNSRCTTDPNLAMNLKEINQPSPDSVLETHFKEENPFASEFSNSPLADLSGLAMKLELLDSESEETNSECSGMNVSSDEDSEKGSVDVPQYSKKLWGMFRPEESRDFSYLVDVLDEASLCDRNLDNLYERLHSMEFPVNPSLFEALEKKYGKQTLWLKSDRRLLFDRINSGLKEIMNSLMDIQISAKPLRRRFYSTLRRDEIEEELWMLLLNQEKEVSKDLSEKALGREMKWLELEEDIRIVCREIEESLFNELAAELD